MGTAEFEARVKKCFKIPACVGLIYGGTEIKNASGLYFEKVDISFLQSIIGNHLITISEYNDKVYYLDPTNNKFLTRDNSSIIINKKFIKFNLNKRRNIKNMMQKEEETYVKNLMEEIHTYIICGENIDMFENFYSENKEKYEEINNKMKKLI